MSNYAFGVDIGGTTVKMGFFTKDGILEDKWEIKTDTSDGGSHILEDIAVSIEEYLAKRGLTKDDIFGVGIGCPGPVNKEGIVNKCANLGWGVTPAKEIMEKRLSVRAEIGNDANVAALGELWQGGGKGYGDMIMLTLGTGVGGGVAVDGKLVVGANGAGGEIGHMKVNPSETRTCGCGGKGCLEQYASATGMARLAKEALEKYEGTSTLSSTEVTAKDLWDGVKAGDELSTQVADYICDILGRAMANMAVVTNPGVFVIGGGVSKAGNVLTDMIAKGYEKYAFHACKETKINLATLGNDAGMYGCVRMLL